MLFLYRSQYPANVKLETAGDQQNHEQAELIIDGVNA
jgi:hypothetical protein